MGRRYVGMRLTAITAYFLGSCTAPATNPQQAITRIGPSLVVGLEEAKAVRLLEDNGFRCGPLNGGRWPSRNPAVVRTLDCSAPAPAEPGHYHVVYVSLGIDARGRLAEVSSGSRGGGTVPAERL